MKRKFIGACIALWIWVLLPLGVMPGEAAEEPPAEGAVFPDIQLPVPQDAETRKYLGVGDKETFKIPEIKADVVLIEIFSMYCPYCQREAPRINELYQLIADRNLGDKIKIIGIGASNTPYEVELFRKKYQIPFPLFPDENLSLHSALGQVRTPYFIGVKIGKDGSGKVIYSKLGALDDIKSFLDLLVNQAKL